MEQKDLRAYNNTEFSTQEAAEWHAEFDARTESAQRGYNSIDELATKVKAVEAEKQDVLGNGDINTDKLANNAVTQDKIADDAVGAGQVADNAIGADQLAVTGNGQDGDILESNGDGTFSWTSAPSLSVEDNSINHAKLTSEFTGVEVLTAASSVDINFSSAAVFRLTPNGNTILNILNPKIGVKSIVLIGDGTAHGITFTVSGSSGAPEFIRISGEFAGEAGVKYLFSLQCTDDRTNEEFWYTISEPA